MEGRDKTRATKQKGVETEVWSSDVMPTISVPSMGEKKKIRKDQVAKCQPTKRKLACNPN